MWKPHICWKAYLTKKLLQVSWGKLIPPFLGNMTIASGLYKGHRNNHLSGSNYSHLAPFLVSSLSLWSTCFFLFYLLSSIPKWSLTLSTVVKCFLQDFAHINYGTSSWWCLSWDPSCSGPILNQLLRYILRPLLTLSSTFSLFQKSVCWGMKNSEQHRWCRHLIGRTSLQGFVIIGSVDYWHFLIGGGGRKGHWSLPWESTSHLYYALTVHSLRVWGMS